jgi:hypothetical protein
MTHFKTVRGGIKVQFSSEERVFLGDVLPMLAGIGTSQSDPAAERLRVPVYLDDPEANDEWWRLMGEDLEAARRFDRTVFQRVVAADTPVVLDEDDANAMLRVLNEARLTLGARLGIDVEADHDQISEDGRQVMDYLGWVQEELTIELMRAL